MSTWITEISQTPGFPMRGLPNEILATVLEVGARPELEESFGKEHTFRSAVLQVCAQWRSIVLQTASMWNIIYFSFKLNGTLADWHRELHAEEWAREMYRRSGDFSVDVTLGDNYGFAIETICSEIHRWRVLRIDGGKSTGKALNLCGHGTLALLRCISINSRWPAAWPNSFLTDDQTPNLTSAVISPTHFNAVIHKTFPVAQLTSLTIRVDYEVLFPGLRSVLEQTVSLTRLAVDVKGSAKVPEPSAPLRVASVREFTFSESAPVSETWAMGYKTLDIFPHLLFPNLETLHVRRCSTWDESLKYLKEQASSMPHLSSVTLSQLYAPFDAAAYTIAFPYLTSVALDAMGVNEFLVAMVQMPTSKVLTLWPMVQHLSITNIKHGLNMRLLRRLIQARMDSEFPLKMLVLDMSCMNNLDSDAWLRKYVELVRGSGSDIDNHFTREWI